VSRTTELIAAATSHRLAGRNTEALDCLDQALKLEPGNAGALTLAGMILHAQGRAVDAAHCFERACRAQPGNAELHHNLGVVLQGMRRFGEAAACYERAIQLKPDYAQAYNSLGTILFAQGRYGEAVTFFRASLGLKPDDAETFNNLGVALQATNLMDEAEQCFARALELRPDYIDALVNLGTMRQRLGRTEQAMACFERALALRPDHPPTHNHVGLMMTSLGRLEEARRAFENAIRLDPGQLAYHCARAAVVKFEAGDPWLPPLEEFAKDIDRLAPIERVKLQFALAKACDDLGDYEAGFRYLLAANAERRRVLAYDERAALDALKRIAQGFTAERMRQRGARSAGDSSPVPVFIVGMPRSGTSLVEQILASHPLVFGAGELEDFGRLANALRLADGAPAFPDRVDELADEALTGLGADYLAVLRARAPQATRITDKMPHNFQHIGLIHLALPGAKIIHVRRNPVDTCLSCFSRVFSGEHAYSHDLGELGRYWRAYDGLMAHWRSVLPPGVMLEVDYERIVADLEAEARRMLEHCGLDWSERCLRFHETARQVRTASAPQVRQPLYGSSIGRWQAYAGRLGPLLDALGVSA